MKAILVRGISAALVALGLTVPAMSPRPAAAQGAGQPSGVAVKVAVIDIDGVRRDAKAVQGIRTQILKVRDAFQKELEASEKDLQARQQELIRQRTILSPEAFDAEREKFNRFVAGVKRDAEAKRRALQTAEAQAMQEVQKALNAVIGKLAEEEAITLLLRKDQTVLVARALDITPHVVARLDKALPSVKVTVPNPGAAAGK